MKSEPRYLSRTTAIIILIIIVIIIGVCGYLLSGQFNNNKNTNLSMADRNIEILDWQTYTNKDYGFGIKYPADWKLETAPKFYKENETPGFGGIYIFKEEASQGLRYQLSLFIEENKENLSAEDWVNKLINENKTSYQKGKTPNIYNYQSSGEIKVNEYSGYAIFGLNDLEGRVNHYYISKDNKIFEFIFPTAEDSPNYFNPTENYKIAQKILDTFEFIK